MIKIVSFIVVFIMLTNLFIFPVSASQQRNSLPASAPKAQIKCLPVCALPALPVIIQGLTQLAILFTMITVIVAKPFEVAKELKKSSNKIRKKSFTDWEAIHRKILLLEALLKEESVKMPMD